MANGFSIELSIRDVPGMGSGVFAEQPIQKGMIVWRFTAGCFTVFDEPSFLAAIDGKTGDEIVDELTHSFGFADFPDHIIRLRDEGALINHSDLANVATNFGKPAGGTSRTQTSIECALQTDRYALIATCNIAVGEELLNDYANDISDPAFYERLCAQYGVGEEYLNGA